MADETKPPGDPKVKPEKTTEKLVSINERLLKLYESQKEVKGKLTEYSNETLEHYKAALSPQEETLILSTKQYELEKVIYEQMKKALEDKLKLGGEISEGEQKILETLENSVANLKDLTKGGKELKDAMDDIGRSADHVLSKFTGISSKSEKLGKSVKEAGGWGAYLGKQTVLVADKLKKANLGAALMLKLYEKTGAAAKQLGKWTVGPALEAVDLTSAMDRAIKRQDEMRLASRDVAKLTVSEMENFHTRMASLGKETDGTTEDFIRINKALYQTSNVFRELNNNADPARETLEKTAQTLERRFNIPIADTAKLTDTLSQTFGMAAGETAGFAQSMAVLGKDMGLNVQQLLPQFQAQANNLAKFGLPDLQGQFLQLAKVSQLTGIGMDSIVGSMEKFTTFEGALNAASKLNAVFGSTIDGLELMDTVMEKGPIEGFIQLREQMEANGIEMNSLNYGEMRAMGESLGMSAEQVKAFGEVSVDEFRKTTAGAMSVTEAERRIQEGRKDSLTVSERTKDLEDKTADALRDKAKKARDVQIATIELAESMGIMAGIMKEVITLLGVLAGAAIGKLLLKIPAVSAAFGSIGNAVPGIQRVIGVFGKLAKAAGVAGAAVGAYHSIKAGREDAAKGNTGMAALKGIGGSALSGAMAGAMFGPGGALIGGAIGAVGGAIGTFMAPGQNYTSQPTQTLIGDSLGSETVTKRTQAVLGTGDKVATNAPAASAGPAELNLTINLVTKEGKTLATQTISNQMSHGALGSAVSAILDEKLNLIYG